MTNTSSIEALDRVPDEPEERVDVVNGRVVRRAYGSDTVAAVGVAAEKITRHLTRWCALLPT